MLSNHSLCENRHPISPLSPSKMQTWKSTPPPLPTPNNTCLKVALEAEDTTLQAWSCFSLKRVSPVSQLTRKSATTLLRESQNYDNNITLLWNGIKEKCLVLCPMFTVHQTASCPKTVHVHWAWSLISPGDLKSIVLPRDLFKHVFVNGDN